MYHKLLPQQKGHDHDGPFAINGFIVKNRQKFFLISLLSRISLRRWLIISVVLTIISFFYFNELIPNQFRGIPPQVNFYCFRAQNPSISVDNYGQLLFSTKFKPSSNHRLRSDSRILLFVETQYSHLGRQLIEVFESLRFKYKAESSGRPWSTTAFTNQDKGKFSVIIFENLEKYFKLKKYNRQLLDDYCRQFHVGIVGFIVNNNHTVNESSSTIITQYLDDNYPVKIKSGYKLKDYQLNPASTNVLHVTRAGTINLGPIIGDDWFIFEPYRISNITTLSNSFIPIAQALTNDFLVDTYPGGYRYSTFNRSHVHSIQSKKRQNIDYYRHYNAHLMTTVLLDNGSFDGIQRILFGNGFDHWLHKLLFIDSLHYLSNGKLSLPLKRYIQIDIDDIFVGERGTRMKMADVDALVEFQTRLQQFIPGFRFNVGFSGKYFHRGFDPENQGDDHMIRMARHFRWFCHTYSHSQAHITTNQTAIETEMIANREFARNNNLPVDSDYIVSPHHSGVYPVHEPLYDAWKNVWNVRVTSTEEYPHLRPAYLRHGFIHKGIMVLPRQTCGLYTHTIFIDRYPGGRDKLEKNVFGGDLFFSFIFNQVNVFMTHQSNYANDRLALYTFESVLKFLQCWTNLELHSLSPIQMAKKYFQIYPEERDPIWMNPCDDKRHYNIWSPNKSCYQFPRFLIVGPQKTGSTALYTFLQLHPSLLTNVPSNRTFEEIQFFNGPNYHKGIDWYMQFFPLSNLADKFNMTTSTISNITPTVNNANNGTMMVHNQRNYFSRTPPIYAEESMHYFEKSSTYFDGEQVPMRVHSLLPHARIVIILINPTLRAYSWYQHMRVHNLSVALDFSFYEVVSLNIPDKHLIDKGTMKRLRDLRNRCLNPGMYAIHIERWLSFFPSQQITIIDGEELRHNPISVMDRLQTFLKLEPHIDYHQKIRFDHHKGFFCSINPSTNNTKCLGKSKGRQYPKIDRLSGKYLHRYFWHHNLALSKLLNRLRISLPNWLVTELSRL
ncbi:bifunctional heparan sulfate N-deacetylase/N-sulfotransferase-like protein [Euroglyphus maynei]|uniref:[heparan sulfate]-glucosamine N-sulfotransferase n=1 Tax=Euroglyphus maynei TaxID=6958 RepID=A0A1Y3AYJ4_EURMA|nr:bifunctional heparan sulfate N-deacetylase/N-sulfotransferase-like protein [Euroglyphus maynei]